MARKPNKWSIFVREGTERKQIASILCYNVEDGTFLVIKRSKKDRFKAGYWDLPGGVADPEDASFEAAGVRELSEETSLIAPAESLVYIKKIRLKGADKYVFATTEFSGNIEFAPNPKTGLTEHEEYRWLTPQEISELKLSIVPHYVLEIAKEKLGDACAGDHR